ncbi:E3 ubiquitin-protein ligase RSL1-like [Cornus florida]|uniref:E3 ubiquitin-protein ligase RSL1-like n=1 Tax=Cornus florida TaxID=4283 RepID=UPI00289DA510|nr:E3 ubiquitin-protein ligase RSL1-like [Cornus florida]
MAKLESTSDVQFVDDFYFSALLFDHENEEIHIFPISDAKYAEELQFQEVLMVSLINADQMSSNVAPSTTRETPASKSEVVPIEIEKEVGESSHSFCEICVEKKGTDDMFRNQTCHHSFCSDCISKHVATKIQENMRVVMCPGLDCQGVVELDACRPMIVREVLERWDEMVCESMISASERFYCPFRDCSAMMVNDSVGEVIRESVCPACRRLFCAQCYVPWHPGIECEEFQRLNEDERGKEDLMVRELAKEKKWMRCPECKFYVEKTEGCLHMTCRCGFQFCYACGATYTETHGGCQPPI